MLSRSTGGRPGHGERSGAGPSPPRSKRDTPVHPSAAGRPALLIVILAITAGVPVPASARGQRDSRMFVHGAPPTRVQDRSPAPSIRSCQPHTPRPEHRPSGRSVHSRALGPPWWAQRPSATARPRSRSTRQRTRSTSPTATTTTAPPPGGNTVSVIDARALPRPGRLALQRPLADHHRREHAEQDRDRRADRHRLRDQRTATTPFRCSTAPPATPRTRLVAGRRPRPSPSGWGRSGSSPTRLTTPCTSRTRRSALGGRPDSTTVSMLDSATCNATDLAACPTTAPPTVDVGARRMTSTWTRPPTPCT